MIKKIIITAIFLIESSNVFSSEIFRESYFFNPELLGGTFDCDKTILPSEESFVDRYTKIVVASVGSPFDRICEYASRENQEDMNSHTLLGGIGHDMQFNTFVDESATWFSNYTYNKHFRNRQHTFTVNFFDTKDTNNIPNSRVEYAYSIYYQQEYTPKGTAEKKRALFRAQGFVRNEYFGDGAYSNEVGLRTFWPNFLESGMGVESEFKYVFDDYRNQGRFHLNYSYFMRLVPEYRINGRFDFGLEHSDGNLRFSFIRSEFSKLIRLKRYSLKMFASPIYDFRTDQVNYEVGIFLKRYWSDY